MRKRGNTMRAAIYKRVSTDKQEADGTSLESQESRCREYATAKGWTIEAVLTDTKSGSVLQRPALEQVRDMIRARTVDVVLAYAMDRLSRKQSHVAILAYECDEHGVQLDFVTEDFERMAMGEFMRSA